MEKGELRNGGNWKNAHIECFLAGIAVNLIDNYPRELMSVTLRDFTIFKPKGSVETKTRLTHLQIDAMFHKASYPVILQPVPLGVDRKKVVIEEMGLSDKKEFAVGNSRSLTLKSQYWQDYYEQPFPVVEGTFTYLPQLHLVCAIFTFVSFMRAYFES